MIPETVVVVAKSPQPGRVKTRLQPTFSAAESAALAAAAIRDTLDAAMEIGARRVIVAWDGPPVGWLPSGVSVVPQRGSGLDERLENVFADAFDGQRGNAPTILVGMDTPQLQPADLDVDWRGVDAVFGPAADGGYWAIGFRRHIASAIRGVPMSLPTTGDQQRRRLQALGLSVGILSTLRDVDDPADASEVAVLAPHSRFARLHRRLMESPCCPETLVDAALAGAAVEVRTADHPTGELPTTMPPVLDASPWLKLDAADDLVVARCEGPVLDIGCGPGRFVEALACRGVPALGVDLSRSAVARTRRRGASALVRDVHDRLPAEGRWRTVLLADGNIGIGGDPLSLLRRCRELLHPGAVALVETSVQPRQDTRTTITLHGPSGRRSHAVPWAIVGAETLIQLAAIAGFVAVEDWRVAERAFVLLRHAG